MNLRPHGEGCKLGLASHINMSKGLGIVGNDAMSSSNLLGPVSNNQGNGMMKDIINVFSDNDSQPTQDHLSSISSFGYSLGGKL